MENYKSASQVWLEMQDSEDKLAIDSLNGLYFDNMSRFCSFSLSRTPPLTWPSVVIVIILGRYYFWKYRVL